MFRLGPILFVAGAAVLAGGCSPEVVIARSDSSVAGGGSGGGGSGGTGAGSGGGPTEAMGGEGASPSMEPARLLADSVADFSFTQGEHGWYYGYDTGALDTFSLLTKTQLIVAYQPATNQRWEGWAGETAHWTQIFEFGAHPNGTISNNANNSVLQRAVRRWVSPVAGDIVIKGELAKIDLIPGSGTNGVDGLVYVDGTSLFSHFIEPDDGAGLSFEIPATVHVDSTVDFVLDPHESDDRHDLSRFTGIILRAEPAPTP